MKQEYFSVGLSLVAMLMVTGVSGDPGLNAHFLVVEESSLGDVCVIIRPLRVVEEAA